MFGILSKSQCVDSGWTKSLMVTVSALVIKIIQSSIWIHRVNWFICHHGIEPVNTLRPRQDGRRFPDDTFERIFLNENVIILIKISLKFVPNGPINNSPALVQIMAWRRLGDKPLSEPMMAKLPTHMCVTRPQWVNSLAPGRYGSNFKSVIPEHMFQIKALSTSCEITLRRMAQNTLDDKSPLI